MQDQLLNADNQARDIHQQTNGDAAEVEGDGFRPLLSALNYMLLHSFLVCYEWLLN